MATDPWTQWVMTISSVALGGLIALVTSIVTARLNAESQRKLEQERYQRAYQDALRAKLEDGYGKLILAARRMSRAIKRQKFLLLGETSEQRDKTLGEYVSEAWLGIEHVIIGLEMERDAGDVLAAFHEIDEAIISWRSAKGVLDQLTPTAYGVAPATTATMDSLLKSKDEAEEKIHNYTERLAMTAQQHLDRLRSPAAK